MRNRFVYISSIFFLLQVFFSNSLIAQAGNVLSFKNYNLKRAIEKGDVERVKHLINKGAEVNLNSNTSYWPLARAVQQGNIEIVQILLDQGADVKAIDHYTKEQILHHVGNYPEIIGLLIERGANVNANAHYVGNSGWTPLHHAANIGINVKGFETLLKYGANINAYDSMGRNPLGIAVMRKNWDIVKLIEEYNKNLYQSGNFSLVPHPPK